MRPVLVGLLLLSAPNAFALPSLRLSWDDCGVITPNKSWSGPGTYTLVVSGTGFTDHYSFVSTGMGFNPRHVVPAWDFSTIDYWTGQPGCQGPSRLSITNGPSSCASYPATLVSGMMAEGSLTSPAPTGLWMYANLDPSFTPDPSTRYTLFRIDFDHSQSVTGAQQPPVCGYVDFPMCIVVVSRQLNSTTVTGVAWADEVAYATWQDPANTMQCPGATPTVAKTWGAIKASYR